MGEPLIMAEIEVGFSAIVGNEDLSMLKGRHGAGIDVDVWVKLYQRNTEAASLEETANRRGRQTFSQARNHTTRNKDVFSHW